MEQMPSHLKPAFSIYLALLLASRRIWQPVGDCQPSTVCSQPQVRLSYQWLFGLVVLLVEIAAVFPYIAPLFY